MKISKFWKPSYETNISETRRSVIPQHIEDTRAKLKSKTIH